MKKIKDVLGLVFCFFLINHQSVWADSGPTILSLREEILKTWLNQAESLSQKTSDANAKSIAKFLREETFIVEPHLSDTGLAARVAQEPKGLAVAPLVDSDENKGKRWKEEYNSNLASVFVPNPEMPLFILKDNIKMSGVWKGLIMLHEGSHALAFMAGVFDEINDPILKRSVDEYHAYSMEINVLHDIGGEEYKKILAEETARIKKQYQKDKSLPQPNYGNADKLNKAFGEPNSEMERGIRWSTMWIHAVFKAMEEIHGQEDKAEQAKIDCLASLYKQGALK